MLNMNELRYLAIKSAASAKDTMTDSAAMTQSNLREGSKEPGPNGKGLNTGLNPAEPGYGRSLGIGAGAGALAGIPLALLAHALMAGKEKRGLRDYLKSGLLGALLGGGVGAAGGFGLRKYMLSNPGELEGMLEGAKTHNYLAPDSMRNLTPSLRFKRISPESLEAANEGRLSIPGVTADSFGLGSEADTFGNAALNKLLAGLNYIKGD